MFRISSQRAKCWTPRHCRKQLHPAQYQSNIILAPIYKVGDEAEGFESGITQIGAAFLVISSDGFYLGLFKSAASADNCYATALILEESLAKMYSKN